ncbi:MAG: YibE/F family protein [Trueperaceae bacterium]
MRQVITLALLALASLGFGQAADTGYVEGRILELSQDEAGQSRAIVRLRDGRTVNATVPAQDAYAPSGLPEYRGGQRVELYFSPAPGREGRTEYVVVDWVRRPALYWLVALFLFASVVVARLKGLRAFTATAVSLAIVVMFIVPRILEGWNPMLVSLLGVGGILLLAIYFVHGVNWSTTAALTGTLVAVILTMALGVLFTELAHLTGYGSEEALLISFGANQVSLKGLLLAGLLVGALGALTDITIVQASVVRELSHVNPELDWPQLYRRGMNVGLDHIGSLVNTLVLAYVGASLPLLVLLTLNDFSLGRALNIELVAAEVVHTLVGSIGLILAVPLTTLIAALLFRGDRLKLVPGELEHAHGH